MIEKSKFSNESFMVAAYLLEDFLLEATVAYGQYELVCLFASFPSPKLFIGRPEGYQLTLLLHTKMGYNFPQQKLFITKSIV